MVKLVSGMESKRSTNTCVPRDSGIKINLKTGEEVHTHTRQTKFNRKRLQYAYIRLMKPLKEIKGEERMTSNIRQENQEDAYRFEDKR